MTEESAAYNEFTAHQESRIFEAGEALSTSSATTVRVKDGETVTTDGPFAETKEALAGFYRSTPRTSTRRSSSPRGIPAASHGSDRGSPHLVRRADAAGSRPRPSAPPAQPHGPSPSPHSRSSTASGPAPPADPARRRRPRLPRGAGPGGRNADPGLGAIRTISPRRRSRRRSSSPSRCGRHAVCWTTRCARSISATARNG